jgi:hypothetical protein
MQDQSADRLSAPVARSPDTIARPRARPSRAMPLVADVLGIMILIVLFSAGLPTVVQVRRRPGRLRAAKLPASIYVLSARIACPSLQGGMMRRLLVLTCVAALLGLLVAVAPAIVRPDANRAEATVYCDAYQTVAQHGSWEAKVRLCVEVLGSGVRPGVLVYCSTAISSVPCNWDFNPLHLHNQNATLIRSERVHATEVWINNYLATPGWANRSQCNRAYSDSPQLRVRFPDGHLTDWKSATWQGPTIYC